MSSHLTMACQKKWVPLYFRPTYYPQPNAAKRDQGELTAEGHSSNIREWSGTIREGNTPTFHNNFLLLLSFIQHDELSGCYTLDLLIYLLISFLFKFSLTHFCREMTSACVVKDTLRNANQVVLIFKYSFFLFVWIPSNSTFIVSYLISSTLTLTAGISNNIPLHGCEPSLTVIFIIFSKSIAKKQRPN